MMTSLISCRARTLKARSSRAPWFPKYKVYRKKMMAHSVPCSGWLQRAQKRALFFP
jgi:hypothetical protein